MKRVTVSRPRMRLFQSDALEYLTVISPMAFALLWLAILSLTAWSGWGTAGVWASIGLFLLGLMIWTLFEYAMHRFLFHWKTRSRIFKAVVFVTHGNHHVEPNDPYRNLMPPIISVPVLAAVWALCLLVVGPPGTVLFLGFMIGYVLYDGVHYACHQFPMRRGLLRHLRQHHIRHHYTRQEGNYAITATIWDWVFGTHIPVKGR
jgi:sterol desaturase/sphingolipid hydroxylase (fatty acid hydroxylase superfamily)